ncbi:MAG: serine hydrolase [Anaerolineaceae bacterium]
MAFAGSIPTDEELAVAIDELMTRYFKADEPGASIIVTRKGKPVFRKGYGMANVELGVKIEPHMVFRLGSITKQFTAVCILMLWEQGKLDLQDEITKHIPGYPMHGHRITVEHLLTHTSGIRSYTDTPDFMKMMRTDLTLEELVNSFKPYPMDFAPGTQYHYNNSAFVMLGLIIEKVSGMTYAEFLKKNIFEPLGMNDTYFDMPNPIIPGRVAGYKKAGDHYENCDYISMTLPHAAGSMASSVDDMAKWDAALYTEKLVKQESLKKAWTSYTLLDGTKTGYGYGWASAEFAGHRMITHGGGINGFITDGFRFPDDEVYVSILTNRGIMIPGDIAFRIGAMAAGKPYVDPQPIPFDPALYERYQGVYKLENMDYTIAIIAEGGKLFITPPGDEKHEIFPVSETEFASTESIQRYIFALDENGKAKMITLKGFYGPGMKAMLTDQPLPNQRKSIELAPEKMAAYLGEYELAPGVNACFVFEDGRLIVKVPGQKDQVLLAESEEKFFMSELPVSFEFHKDAAGQVTGMTLNQSGHTMDAKKVK